MNTPRIAFVTSAAIAIAALFIPFAGASAQEPSSSVDVVRAHRDGHAYQNGGIGQEQVARMQRHMQPYDLQLTFSEGKHNAYVADVKLSIFDAEGKRVFALREAGPLTDVALPAGHYRVVADFAGIKRDGSVDVRPGQASKLNLHWPRDAA